MLALTSAPVVGPQATPLAGHPCTLSIAPPWGKGDPPISVTGMLPRPLGKTWAGGNMWQHMCSLDSPEFKDALLIARAKKGTERTPEEHTILSHALKHKKPQAHASKLTPFMIPPGIMKELTSMMQTWLLNCSPNSEWKMLPLVQHGMRLQSVQLQGRSCDLLYIWPR